MNTDQKVRVWLMVASFAVPAFTALAAIHGFHIKPLDTIGGDGP